MDALETRYYRQLASGVINLSFFQLRVTRSDICMLFLFFGVKKSIWNVDIKFVQKAMENNRNFYTYAMIHPMEVKSKEGK